MFEFLGIRNTGLKSQFDWQSRKSLTDHIAGIYASELYDNLKQGAQVCASVWLQIRIANELRAATVEKLWEITEELNILYRDNWTALVDREMAKFQKELFLSGISKHSWLGKENGAQN